VRICYFTPHFLPKVGGTELVTDALAREFHAAGHHVVVLARGRPVTLDLPYPVQWYRKPKLHRWFPERIGRALMRSHRRHRFDIILANYASPTGYAALRVGRKVGLPVVVVSHGGDLFRHGKDRTLPHIWKRTEYTYRHADALVSISAYIEELIREINPSPCMIERIPNGIDGDALRAPSDRPRDYTDSRPFCLCLGNLVVQKGFGDAIAAFAEAQARLGDLAMVIVGGGRLEESLRHRVGELGIQDDVSFLGRRMGNDKHWFLQNCRFGIAPSLEEGHPLVGLEFLAVGKPIICTTIAPFDGMYDHGVNGLRVPPGKPQPLAEAMIRLNEADREAMGRVCLERARVYAWPRIAQRYIEFFERVLESQSPAPTHTG